MLMKIRYFEQSVQTNGHLSGMCIVIVKTLGH